MKRLLPLFAIAATLPLCGSDCGDDPGPTQNTYDHVVQTRQEWLAQGLPDINLGCKNEMIKLYVSYLPQAQLQQACGVAGTELYGCLNSPDGIRNVVYVLSDVQGTVRADYVIEHEFRHWFGGCTPLGTDGNHVIDKIWYSYKGQSIRG